ncbi:MAG: N-acetyltransferase [Salinibacterium sp.]|nr:MAG: N-acetyltransferase [Salinibacterium sp.]
MSTEVLNDPSMNRYELLMDGERIGATDYQIRDDTIVFLHTEIDPEHREHGLGSELARGALNLVRAETDYRVVTRCPFMAAWVAKHPEYQDLLSR